MSEKWCPHGRIARFARSQGRIELISFGGFNIIEIDPHNGNMNYRTPCIGDKCTHFKKSPFFRGKGRCGLEPQSSSFSILLAYLLVAGFVIAFKYM